MFYPPITAPLSCFSLSSSDISAATWILVMHDVYRGLFGDTGQGERALTYGGGRVRAAVEIFFIKYVL